MLLYTKVLVAIELQHNRSNVNSLALDYYIIKHRLYTNPVA